MLYSIRHFSCERLLAYMQDCHGLNPYDLGERDINTKSKSDVAEIIECYGWSRDCFDYLS